MLLMVQKSDIHQLRLVVYPIIYKVSCIHTVVGLGISEPSTAFLPPCLQKCGETETEKNPVATLRQKSLKLSVSPNATLQEMFAA